MIKNIVAITLFCATCVAATAQSDIPFKELELNLDYMELKSNEEKLENKIEELEQSVKDKKEQVNSKEVNITTLTTQIIEVEGNIFTLRNELTATQQKSALIEQEYLLNNPNAVKDEKKGNQKPFSGAVIDHPEIANLATPTERETIAAAKQFNQLADQTYSAISLKYNSLKEYIAPYTKTGDIIEGKEIKKLFNEDLRAIKESDNHIGTTWSNIYETKLYLYNRYLDKISAPKSVLDHLNLVSRENRSVISEVAPLNIAPSLSSYTREEIIILEYEKELAKLLSAPQAVDSLTNEIKQKIVNRYDLKSQELPIQRFISYQPITRISSKAHTAKNPPKELTLPSNGEVHKVQIGIYSKKISNLAALYSIAPVEYYKSPKSGKYYYWAGSYKTLKEASAASQTLNRAKLNTFTSSWVDGKHIKHPSLSAGEYRIEIKEVTAAIRESVANYQSEKQIINSTNELGERVYYIGIFENKNEAEDFAKQLGTATTIVPLVE